MFAASSGSRAVSATENSLAGKADLQIFFASNPEFIFPNTRLSTFIESKPAAVAEVQDVPQLKSNLSAMQRVYRVAPQYSQMRSLVGEGVSSAMQITNMGLPAFTSRLGALVGGPGEAARIYERASRTHAMASTLLATFRSSSSNVSIDKWPDWGRIFGMLGTEQTGIPDWSALFGSSGICSCPECRSTTGPAAYLVDMLHFLQQRPVVDKIVRDAQGRISSFTNKTRTDLVTGKTAILSARDVLFDRRPDLGDIELSCQNTNTPLPYIDLVNEILENAVAPPGPFTPFDVPAALAAQLDRHEVDGPIRNLFHPPLSEFAHVTAVSPGRWWTIDEPAFTYTIRDVAPPGAPPTYQAQRRSLQTRGPASARIAAPQYTNSAAYDVLQTQVFPWSSLPFDLWSATTWTYLASAAIGRYELMELFQPDDSRAASLGNIDMVRDFLGLTPVDLRLIVGETTAQEGAASPGPWNLWGFAAEELGASAPIPAPASSAGTVTKRMWTEVVTGRVDVFLQQSGIKFGELLNLVQVSGIFFAESQRLEIQIHQGEPADTCDPSRMGVVGADAGVLVSISQFFRLLRKLDGWNVLDLALALGHFGVPGRTQDMKGVLIKISHVKRLMKMLDRPLDVLLAFWYRIGTVAWEDKEGDEEDVAAESLYSRTFRHQPVSEPAAHSAAQDPPPLPQDPGDLTGSLSDHVLTITAALHITAAELQFLVDSGLVVADGELSWDNLSSLFRHTVLAGALGLSAADYLLVLKLVDHDPFASTLKTVIFVERVQSAAQSGFSWAELSSILRHDLPDVSVLQALDQTVVAFLGDVRPGIRAIALDNAVDSETVDGNGDLTSKKLALLGWDAGVVSQAIAILNDTASYSVPLATAPPAVANAQLRDRLSYDANAALLSYSRVMTDDDAAELNAIASASEAFKAAVDALYQAPRTHIARNMRSFSVPDFSVGLAALPAGVKIPSSLRTKVSFIEATGTLRSAGPLSDVERLTLLGLSTIPAYVDAVNALFRLPDSQNPAPADAFLGATDISAFFDAALDASGQPIPASVRYKTILQKLLPFLREKLSKQLVRQKVAEFAGVSGLVAERLLDSWVTYSSVLLNNILRSPAFVESADSRAITTTSFPDQYNAVVLLSKIGAVITKMKLTAIQLAWIFEFRKTAGDPTAGWLDLNTLPVAATPTAFGAFAGWERLCALQSVRDGLPGGEKTLDAVFRAARSAPPGPDAIPKLLADDLKTPVEGIVFLLSPAAALNLTFKDEGSVARILRAIRHFNDVGCSPADGQLLASAEVTQRQARVAQLSIKSKHDEATWNSTIVPQLSNVLREARRSALLSYLLAHRPSGVTAPWRKASDLFAYFLIDVEMGPCMKTSRIKQAISSVQLFAQRCLMNLEPDVKANVEADVFWRQWEWMKSFRIAGANRQVFETPENFLEPGVRDDKTQFFTELESELQQADVTQDTASTALLNYLEKLDHVSRMEVVSFYHQRENDGLGNTAVDVLHIFARTKAKPRRLWYCQRVDASYWTSWEKVDVDVQGDHLIPLVWNRRLHLFWAIFTEKTEKTAVVMPETGKPVQAPPTFWEIKLAWTERKHNKWQPKVLSDAFLVCSKSDSDYEESDLQDLPGRSLITFRAEPDADTGELYIRCHAPRHIGDFYFNGVRGQPAPLHAWRGWRPRELGLGLGGLIEPVEAAWALYFDSVKAPAQSRIQNMGFGEAPTSDGQLWVRTDKLDALAILGRTPGSKYSLVTAHQDFLFQSGRPFWFQHDQSSFFVEPREVPFPAVDWFPNPLHINPGLLDGRVTSRYYDVARVRDLPLPYPPPTTTGPLRFGQTFAERSDLVAVSRALSDVVGGDAHSGLGIGARKLAAAATPSRPLAVAAIKSRIRELDATRKIDASSFSMVATEGRDLQPKEFTFSTFYHPYVSEMIRVLNRDGIDGLYQRPLQLVEPKADSTFDAKYKPSPSFVHPLHPSEVVDFDDNVFGVYNWELFFHVPVLIADRLSRNQQFKRAQQWYHYVFNPMDTTPDIAVPQRYWVNKKLFQISGSDYANQTLKAVLGFLAKGGDPAVRKTLQPEELRYVEQLEKSVARWRADPFRPFAVARARMTSFQKWLVMKYLDNLIAWGDALFAGDTIELINEATQIYMLAADLLGPRPLEMAPPSVPEVQTYNQLAPRVDAYGNALAAIEELVPPADEGTMMVKPWTGPMLPTPMVTYFCASKNDKLLGYWDTVENRLFKIRHCMNLMGIVRELPLSEPRIDPSRLIQAAAAGVDLSSAVADTNAPLPYHRFGVLVAKTTELCQELKSLGGAILAAIEKKDAGQLALLQSTHSKRLLEAIKTVRLQQVEDAAKVADGLSRTKDVVQERFNYYNNRPLLNELEIAHVAMEAGLLIPNLVVAGTALVTGIIHLIPEIKLGAPTSIGATVGGSNIGKSSSNFAKAVSKGAEAAAQASRMLSEMATYQRRKEDWDLQARLASKELLSLESQIASANLRFTIADTERQNHELQIDHAVEEDAFLRSKFTAVELYDWTVAQLSGVYFQMYRLAYDSAKRAERALAFELLGTPDVPAPGYIAFDYWDSLRRGLTTGERLLADLKRMEMAYLDHDTREYELTRNVSLAQLDPAALVRLRQVGDCTFSIPEALFDLDYPGHYLRRLRSVALTLPCIAGPYTPIAATLTLLRSSTRISPNLTSGKYARRDNDPRFVDGHGASSSIATSTAVDDPGLFEPSLRDDRYLPFERRGAISTWRLRLPSALPQFDPDTLSDAVLTLRYTSREGGAPLAAQATAELRTSALDAITLGDGRSGLARLFDVPNEFADAWRRFGIPEADTPQNAAALALNQGRFPYAFAPGRITITAVDVFVRIRPEFGGSHNETSLTLGVALDGAGGQVVLGRWDPVPGTQGAKPGVLYRGSVAIGKAVGTVQLTGSLNNGGEAIDTQAVGLFVLLCYYKVAFP